jgi:hypothetical protein
VETGDELEETIGPAKRRPERPAQAGFNHPIFTHVGQGRVFQDTAPHWENSRLRCGRLKKKQTGRLLFAAAK